VVHVQVDLDVAIGDQRRPQVDHDLAVAGTDLEDAAGGPGAQPLLRAVVGVDLDRAGGGGVLGVHRGVSFLLGHAA
jgi:hypothetical protein